MSYFGLGSANAVSKLFDTSSSTYSLLQEASTYNSYRTLNNVVSSLKSGIAGASSDEEKAGLQDKLDAIMETMKKNAPASSTDISLDEQAQDEANSILAKYGIGNQINTSA